MWVGTKGVGVDLPAGCFSRSHYCFLWARNGLMFVDDNTLRSVWVIGTNKSARMGEKVR